MSISFRNSDIVGSKPPSGGGGGGGAFSINGLTDPAQTIEIANETTITAPDILDIDEALQDRHIIRYPLASDNVGVTAGLITYADWKKLNDLDSPLQLKGSITVAADFPTSADVTTGWTYIITADVTDNDVTKTNTGQSFEAGQEITWNGINWTELGNRDAKSILYSNAVSGLTATQVQNAIDENVKQSIWVSAGATTDASYTDNGDGTVNIGSVDVLFYPNGTFDEVKVKATLPGKTITLTDGVNTLNYIYADYNAGTPQINVTTNFATLNPFTALPLITATRNGTDVGKINWNTYGLGYSEKAFQKDVDLRRFETSEGLTLGETGTRNVTITSGKVYYGTKLVALPAFNSSTTGILQNVYHVGGVWTAVANAQYNNTQYDDGTDLVELTANRYAVNWVFKNADDDTDIACIVLGSGDYTLAQAEGSSPPAVPASVRGLCVLVGRIIVKKGDTTATIIEGYETLSFNAVPVTNHNDLDNLEIAANTVTYGHIDDQAQTIAGDKTFISTIIKSVGSAIRLGSLNATGGSGTGYINISYPTNTFASIDRAIFQSDSTGSKATGFAIAPAGDGTANLVTEIFLAGTDFVNDSVNYTALINRTTQSNFQIMSQGIGSETPPQIDIGMWKTAFDPFISLRYTEDDILFSKNIGVNGITEPKAILHVGGTVTNIPALGEGGHATQWGGSLFGLVCGTLSSGVGYIQSQRVDGTATAYDLLLQPNGGAVVINSITEFASTTNYINTNSTDGSDTKAIYLGGGGTTATTRGSSVRVHGNEHATEPGKTIIYAGSTATGIDAIDLKNKTVFRDDISIAGALRVGSVGTPAAGYAIDARDDIRIVGADGNQICDFNALDTTNIFRLQVTGTGHADDVIQIGRDNGGNDVLVPGDINAGTPISGGFSARVNITGTSALNSSFSATRNEESTSGSGIYLSKKRATTNAVDSGDEIGFVSFRGYYNATATLETAYLQAIATEDFTSTAGGTKLVFSTTANGNTTPSLAMTIEQDGDISFTSQMFGPNMTGSTGGSDLRWTAGTGQFFYDTSSKRYKTDIKQSDNSDWIYDLQLVNYKHIKGTHTEDGFIAEDVEKITNKAGIEGITFKNRNDEIEGYNKSDLIPYIINEMQKLKKENESQANKINELCKALEVKQLEPKKKGLFNKLFKR